VPAFARQGSSGQKTDQGTELGFLLAAGVCLLSDYWSLVTDYFFERSGGFR